MEFVSQRAMTEEEDKYSFAQSMQISSQCGLIGHLRADMDTNGNGFFSSWFGFRDDLKTPEFKAEFDDVINSLREEGDILHNRNEMAKYCYSHPQAKMQTEEDYYGVRVDTEVYTYFVRMNPNKGEYNAYVYCYVKAWLELHLQKAKAGIRFIDSSYKELFRVRDGASVIVENADGTEDKYVCKFVDDYHLEFGNNLYHICELAERLERNGAKVRPAAEK